MDYGRNRVETTADRTILNLDRVRLQAKAALPTDIFDYLDGGAGREVTQGRNEQDLDAISLRPLTMKDVSRVGLSTSILGVPLPVPIGISPTALHRLVHPDGEVATAMAANTLQIPLTISAMSSVAIEEVAQKSGNTNLWFQTYLYKDPTVARELTSRAGDAGCKAIVLSVGCPTMGYRDRNLANEFRLPQNVTAAHFDRAAKIDHNNPIASFAKAEIDPAATWQDVAEFCKSSSLPVLVKGIMNAADVEPALDAGVSGIIVSNHGGRQLDTTESSIRILPDVSDRLQARAPLIVDSGFRRGTDVLKALAFGADAVFLGRPALWALAVGGAQGVVDAIERLTSELRVAMQLAGCASIDDLRDNRFTLIDRK